MQNALWNNKKIIAAEIALNYTVEKEIRKASGRKELKCPDPECQNSTVRYCHGEIKDAFFAHLNNEECDYAKFDRNDTNQMRTLRCILYEHFKGKGYNVRMEVKILDHHYSHLLFEMVDGTKIAVEVGTKSISANRADSLRNQYNSKGVSLKWLVLDNSDIAVNEKHTFFMKRHLLNESVNRDLIVIDPEGKRITQHKADFNKYIYNGYPIKSENYPETYSESSSVDKLDFENNELTIPGFHERYQAWLEKKQNAFKRKIEALDRDKKIRDEQLRVALENERKKLPIHEAYEQLTPKEVKISDSVSEIRNQKRTRGISSADTYEKRRADVLPKLSQQEFQVKDSLGYRWIKCEICGVVDTDDKFVSYGGLHHVNLGVCYSCRDKED